MSASMPCLQSEEKETYTEIAKFWCAICHKENVVCLEVPMCYGVGVQMRQSADDAIPAHEKRACASATGKQTSRSRKVGECVANVQDCTALLFTEFLFKLIQCRVEGRRGELEYEGHLVPKKSCGVVVVVMVVVCICVCGRGVQILTSPGWL